MPPGTTTPRAVRRYRGRAVGIRRPFRCSERGIALLAVLWLIAILGTVASVALLEVRTGIGAAGHRAAAIRGRWEAEGCLARLRAALDRALRAGRERAWRDPRSLAPPDCDVTALPPDDVPLDVNLASFTELEALPGFDERLAARVLEARAWGRRIEGFGDLAALAGADGEARLVEAYTELRERIAYEPAAWRVTAGERVTERWVRGGRRVAVVGRVLR